jgi:Domain of unknown function (DUF4279)
MAKSKTASTRTRRTRFASTEIKTSGQKTLMEHGRTTARPKPTQRRDGLPAGAAKIVSRRGAKPERKPNAADDATFKLTLLIRHPDFDPDLITETLKLKPFRYWRRGEPRITPKGTTLAGEWPDTRWNHVAFYEADRTVSVEIERWLVSLDRNGEFIRSLVSTGGDITLNLAMPGQSHRGDVIAAGTLRRAADLGVGIGIEVFPDWNGEMSPGYEKSK